MGKKNFSVFNKNTAETGRINLSDEIKKIEELDLIYTIKGRKEYSITSDGEPKPLTVVDGDTILLGIADEDRFCPIGNGVKVSVKTAAAAAATPSKKEEEKPATVDMKQQVWDSAKEFYKIIFLRKKKIIKEEEYNRELHDHPYPSVRESLKTYVIFSDEGDGRRDYYSLEDAEAYCDLNPNIVVKEVRRRDYGIEFMEGEEPFKKFFKPSSATTKGEAKTNSKGKKS